MLLFFGLAIAAAQAPPPPIVNGETSSNFPAVGALVACNEEDTCVFFCSATLISPDAVLTAAHCIEAFNDDVSTIITDPTPTFIVGPDIGNASARAVIAQFIANPDYSDAGSRFINDTGVGLLAAPIDSVDPLPLLLDAPNSTWIGEPLTFLGYGATGDDEMGSGVKREADIPVTFIDTNFFLSEDPADAATAKNVCFGDSGGAVVRDDPEHGVVLAGVNSFVFNNDDKSSPCEGGGNGTARIDRSVPFIESFADFEGKGELDPAIREGGITGDTDGTTDQPGACATAPGYSALEAGLWLGLVGMATAFRRINPRRINPRRINPRRGQPGQ
ncbi:MAG: trypsin-like serine protease [Myxococcota bacterium]